MEYTIDILLSLCEYNTRHNRNERLPVLTSCA